MKLTIEHLAVISGELEGAIREHPKAKCYFDTEANEIRVTYPLPQDFGKFQTLINPTL